MNPTVSESGAGRTAPKPAGPKPPPRRRVRVAEGIYKDRHGLAATVKVNGIQREVRFPRGTPLKTIRAHRDELRASLRTLPAGGRHTLGHDTGRYLDQVKSTLISFGDRRRELLAWLPWFGHLRTARAAGALARPQRSAPRVAADARGLDLQPPPPRSDEPRPRASTAAAPRSTCSTSSASPCRPRSPAGSTAATSPACSPTSRRARSRGSGWS